MVFTSVPCFYKPAGSDSPPHEYQTLLDRPDYELFEFTYFIEIGRIMGASSRDESTWTSDIKREHGELSMRSLPSYPKNGDFGSLQHLLSLGRSTYQLDHVAKYRQACVETKNHKECRNFQVLDHRMPKSVAYLLKSNCEFVKNIHIDKAEVPRNICLVENCELDHNAISFLLNPGEDGGNESFRENAEKVPLPLDELEMGVVQEPTQDSRKFVPEKMIKRGVEGGAKDEYETSTCHSTKQNLPDTFHQLRHDLGTENKLLPEDSVPENLKRSIQKCQDSNQDSSFNAADPLLSQIKELVQLPYCGSVSFRSNSSTTSSQSFAFPLLPSEWSGSPIKMAKPDHKQSQKQGRTWRMIFMCCKF